MSNSHLILIDALNLIRRIYAVQERPFIHAKNQDTGELSASTQQQVIANTQAACNIALEKLLFQQQASHALAVFDCQKPCWRYQLFDGYKKGRKKMPDALAQALTDIQDSFMALGVDSLTSEEDEADDLIATLATKMAIHGKNVTIISTDKGFLSLLSPNVKVYDYFNRRYLDQDYINDKFNVRSSQLIDFWTLTGDSTNKIPGVPGIGSITAAKLLNEYGSIKALENATDLKPAILDKLHDNKQQMELTKTLFTLKSDIPLGFNLKDIRLPHAEH
ncbi:flap endonuclease Xni [Litorilituus lipolyticus]|uniref:Flap endonuclease Xni n=1 Tax=Litorilituus lipolyticus TaxID=2491017 RepID=A0A502KQQ0_9GAMM|nr:flap endonuclease Xni [Litorilituus lipolyticus]TPH12545.1 flap endonuclease Xni [Litorilituus lipolyticus]